MERSRAEGGMTEVLDQKGHSSVKLPLDVRGNALVTLPKALRVEELH